MKIHNYLKGIIISISIGLLLTLLLIPFGCSGEYIKICYWTLPYQLGSLPTTWLLQKIIFFKPLSFFAKGYIVIPASIITYALIGVLIVYIKNKKRNTNIKK